MEDIKIGDTVKIYSVMEYVHNKFIGREGKLIDTKFIGREGRPGSGTQYDVLVDGVTVFASSITKINK